MERDQIKATLKQIFAERLMMEMDQLDVSDDAGLFDEDGWAIDSVDVLDLVLGIEKHFGVRIAQDDAVKEHFRSLNTLAAYIEGVTGKTAVA